MNEAALTFLGMLGLPFGASAEGDSRLHVDVGPLEFGGTFPRIL